MAPALCTQQAPVPPPSYQPTMATALHLDALTLVTRCTSWWSVSLRCSSPNSSLRRHCLLIRGSAAGLWRGLAGAAADAVASLLSRGPSLAVRLGCLSAGVRAASRTGWAGTRARPHYRQCPDPRQSPRPSRRGPALCARPLSPAALAGLSGAHPALPPDGLAATLSARRGQGRRCALRSPPAGAVHPPFG